MNAHSVLQGTSMDWGGGGGRGIMDVLVEPYILLFHITQEIS